MNEDEDNVIRIDRELVDFNPGNMTVTRDGGKTWLPAIMEQTITFDIIEADDPLLERIERAMSRKARRRHWALKDR